MKVLTPLSYQIKCESTWIKQDWQTDVNRCLFGIVGEVGEVFELFKKRLRGDRKENFIECLEKEIGDVCYYIAMLCNLLGLDLETIMQNNLDKLASRKRRGKIKGSGDNR